MSHWSLRCRHPSERCFNESSLRGAVVILISSVTEGLETHLLLTWDALVNEQVKRFPVQSDLNPAISHRAHCESRFRGLFHKLNFSLSSGQQGLVLLKTIFIKADSVLVLVLSGPDVHKTAHFDVLFEERIAGCFIEVTSCIFYHFIVFLLRLASNVSQVFAPKIV